MNPDRFTTLRSAVRVAALMHDIGKASVLFQRKLQTVLRGKKPHPDAIRHELISAVVWDCMTQDTGVADALTSSTLPEDIGAAWERSKDKLWKLYHDNNDEPLGLGFAQESGLRYMIGMLVLTHHKLPDTDSSYRDLLCGEYMNWGSGLKRGDLDIAKGGRYWHEDWWVQAIREEAQTLSGCDWVPAGEVGLRASLMFADHIGSFDKQTTKGDGKGVHLANTRDGEPADSLSKHHERVGNHARETAKLLYLERDSYPSLCEGDLPPDIESPPKTDDIRFQWQGVAAAKARETCAASAGGFFGCILAATGTGKTRGAPTILAGAAMGDALPERRYLRMCLALGLRVLATQSATEYVRDLQFKTKDIVSLVGSSPIKFDMGGGDDGSESLIDFPDWLNVSGGQIDPRLPPYCKKIMDCAGSRGERGMRMLAPPVLVCTIDHLMDVASPLNARFLLQVLRLTTSDLILDEIDQFDGEDIAAIARLVYQSGVAGRRVMIMSATLSRDIAVTLHTAYCRGWSVFAGLWGLPSHVNTLCTGDSPDSCYTSKDGAAFEDVLESCIGATLSQLSSAPVLRKGEVLPPCESWKELVHQVDESCMRLHDLNATLLDGVRVSFGMVKMTLVAHTAALAHQLPSGDTGSRRRYKLCLHSQYPRVHRQWVETILKQRALTRKGENPDEMLRKMLRGEGILQNAQADGITDVEVVLITSPVIETGNDLDFDYAIIDPISLRSIIQTAGRVNRHRMLEAKNANVLVLGKCAVAMQRGKLAMPGVETPPHKDTKVAAQRLDLFEGRLFRDMSGAMDLSKITASSILDDKAEVPLRDAESALMRGMIGLDGNLPVGAYTRMSNARLSRKCIKMRKFRRSQTGDVTFFLDDEGEWRVRFGEERDLPANDLHIREDLGRYLLSNILERALQDVSPNSQGGMEALTNTSIPDYARETVAPQTTYTEQTGFSLGTGTHLESDYGKE